uniref:Uncharacterized protein n=1 Tax=Anguilla anguilla TaxID=7936 RepID=A0A0E9VM28_ANGAN
MTVKPFPQGHIL